MPSLAVHALCSHTAQNHSLRNVRLLTPWLPMFSHSQKKIERNSHEAKNTHVACFKSTLILGFICVYEIFVHEIFYAFVWMAGTNSELRQSAIWYKIWRTHPLLSIVSVVHWLPWWESTSNTRCCILSIILNRVLIRDYSEQIGCLECRLDLETFLEEVWLVCSILGGEISIPRAPCFFAERFSIAEKSEPYSSSKKMNVVSETCTYFSEWVRSLRCMITIP
jgi:hypothetical protein